jgi:Zn-dependent protease
MASWGSIIIAVVAALSMLLVFNWRRPVRLARSVFVKLAPEAVWPHVDYLSSRMEWQKHIERLEFDQDGRTVRQFYSLKRDDGSKVEWDIQFEVIDQQPDKFIRLRRTGLHDTALDDRLIEREITLKPQSGGTLVSFDEQWGPRSLTGFALAHMDAAASLSRLKSWIETGNASPKGSNGWTSIIISAASLAATAAAFSLLLGWEIGVIFVGLLVLHELGHLLSFRMIGQPWGKIIFMPFLGGVAVSRVPHIRLADDAFCAIMGAGLSMLALLPAVFFSLWDVQSPYLLQLSYVIAAIAGGLNLLNLLPVFPLDGGRVLRAVLQSLLPAHVRTAMFVLAGLVATGGLAMQNPVMIAIAVVAFFQSTRLGPAKANVALMSPYAASVMFAFYLSIVTVHGVAMVKYWPSLS